MKDREDTYGCFMFFLICLTVIILVLLFPKPNNREVVTEFKESSVGITSSDISSCVPENIIATIYQDTESITAIVKADKIIYKCFQKPARIIRPRITRYNVIGNIISYIEADNGTAIVEKGLLGLELNTLTLEGNVRIRQYQKSVK